MFNLGQYSVQLIDAKGNSCLLDCDSFENARSRARRLFRRHDPCMLNIIQWDHRKLQPIKEWYVGENHIPIQYSLHSTIQ
jgi:hypothetical protein